MPDVSAGAWLADLRVLRAERGAVRAIPCHHIVTSGVADVPFAEPVEGRLVLTNLGSVLRVEGTLATHVELVCDLCAAPFRHLLTVAVDEEFPWSGSPEEPGGPAPDSYLVGSGEGLMLDLGALVREALVLGLPMVARCRPDCLGLCARCGAELHVGPCACGRSGIETDEDAVSSIDPRLVPLASWQGSRRPHESAG
jgi:uncharacterized metal-binding protein YceD (DUF177 family)